MKAVMCEKLMGPEALTVGDVPVPELFPAGVLISIEAAALNFPDVLITQGKYQFKPPLPFTPGGEGAGIIEAVGADVSDVNVGDRVIFWCQTGAFAEKIVVPAAMTIKVPVGVSAESAAGLTITYGTTLHGLKDRAGLKNGETLLVLGAAGGVGLAAVQLGKAMGARVIAAASSAEKLAACKAAGADSVINYSDNPVEGVEKGKDFKSALKACAPDGVDVIYDPVGGSYSEAAFRAIAPGGRHLVVGFAAGDIPRIPLNLCLLKQASLVGVFWGAWAMASPVGQGENMRLLFDWIASGDIAPHVGGRYSLEQAVDAYRDLTERRAVGKIMLVP